MPTIQFDGPPMSREKKAELIAKLTQTAHEVLDIPKEVFRIYIRENNPDNVGTGGVMLSEKQKQK